ncbi:MAG: hypothetical protein K0Q91_1387 [Fibrobacteria bacterium]|nr:hypothetical protein [Fibrobacteria bacterium]
MLLALLIAYPVFPSPSDVEVTAHVDRTEITVGDVVHYEITVRHPDGRVDLPAVRGNIGHFEVQNYRIVPGKAADGRTLVTHALTLSSYTLGPDTLPPQRVEYRHGPDTTPLVLYTPATVVRVRRVSPENTRDIADITGPEPLRGTVPWGLIALAAAAVGYWFYRDWRKKHPRKLPAASRPPLPPYEDALEKLRALEQAGLPSQGRGREFAFTLSEIMRAYLGRRYDIDAMEATTEELIQRASLLPLAPQQQEWLRTFTGDLDLVKYATGALAEAEAARQIEAAREFLRATKPDPTGVGSGKPPAETA